MKTLKEGCQRCPIHLHTHNTTGTGDMVMLKAIEAGCRYRRYRAFSAGKRHLAACDRIHWLRRWQGTEYDTGLRSERADRGDRSISAALRERMQAEGFSIRRCLGVDVNTLMYQVPGGMLSNLINQLKQAGKSDKLYEVLAEVPRVREDFGYPPLVTPTISDRRHTGRYERHLRRAL